MSPVEVDNKVKRKKVSLGKWKLTTNNTTTTTTSSFYEKLTCHVCVLSLCIL